MRTMIFALSLAVALGIGIGLAPRSVSAGKGDAECRKAVIDSYLEAEGEEGTRGDAISDGFYGNEPNMANGAPGGPSEQEPGTKGGNVVPSQSPGPKVTNPDGSVRDGASWGDVQQAVKDTCG